MEKWSKIEGLIKEKFDNSVVEPPADLWKSLEDKLNDSEHKNSKKGQPSWLMMAASVLLLLGGTYFFLFPNTDRNTKVELEQLPENQQIQTVQQNRIEKRESFTTITKTKIPEKSVVVVKPAFEKPQSIAESILEKRAEVNSEVLLGKKVTEKLYDLDQVALTALDRTSTNSFSIDPKSLLNEVEGELKIEYRATVFDQIKRNLKEARTNFANRNYEKTTSY